MIVVERPAPLVAVGRCGPEPSAASAKLCGVAAERACRRIEAAMTLRQASAVPGEDRAMLRATCRAQGAEAGCSCDHPTLTAHSSLELVLCSRSAKEASCEHPDNRSRGAHHGSARCAARPSNHCPGARPITSLLDVVGLRSAPGSPERLASSRAIAGEAAGSLIGPRPG